MRISIFKKAEELKERVVKQGELRDRAYFTFKDVESPPLITLACNGKFTYLESCSCLQHSIHGGLPQVNMKNLCAYVLAVYKSLGVKNEDN